jgi:hypothetical protein
MSKNPYPFEFEATIVDDVRVLDETTIEVNGVKYDTTECLYRDGEELETTIDTMGLCQEEEITDSVVRALDPLVKVGVLHIRPVGRIEGEFRGIEYTTNLGARVHEGDMLLSFRNSKYSPEDMFDDCTDSWHFLGAWNHYPGVSLRVAPDRDEGGPGNTLHDTMTTAAELSEGDILLLKTSPKR